MKKKFLLNKFFVGAASLPGEVHRGEGGLQLPPEDGAGQAAQETGGGDPLSPGGQV